MAFPSMSFGLSAQSVVLNDARVMFDEVREPYNFSGLAVYLNNVDVYHFSGDVREKMAREASAKLGEGDYVAVIGRFNVVILRAEGGKEAIVDVLDDSLDVKGAITVQRLSKNELAEAGLETLRYSHLWWPLAVLARTMEALLTFMQNALALNWGWAIIFFGLVVKLILLPLTLSTMKATAVVDSKKAVLAPQLLEIKRTFDGEEAHNRIMDAHRKLNITPFYTLKPMLITLLQFPFLIAVFNVLGELPQLQGSSFLWISDLAYPDSVYSFSGSLPLLGNRISILPFLMFSVTLLSIAISVHGKETGNSSAQYKTILLMPIAFLVLFYPFPASMVLYWMAATFWQIPLEMLCRKRLRA